MNLPRLTAVPADTSSGRPRPAKRSSEAVLRVRLMLVLGLLGFASLAGVFAAIAWLTAAPEAPQVDVPPTPQARAGAELALVDMLDAENFAVPRAEGIHGDPTGRTDTGARTPAKVDDYAWSRFEQHQVGAALYEVHHFTVAIETAPADPENFKPATIALYDAAVTMLLDDRGPVLAAYPSLAPVPPGSDTAPRVDYAEFDQVQISQAVRDRAAEWADAYAAGDERALYTLTGDTVEGRYLGLGGFTAEDAQVRTVVPTTDGLHLVVRVGVRLTSANGFSMNNEFDLLVGSFQTQRPLILAWGPAGSGPELAPFTNAIRP